MLKMSLAAIAHEKCTILILGSLPGEASLKQQEYYAHPRNLFWKIMCDVLETPCPDDYTDRVAMLLEHNIALWDVIESANRDGSLDSAIKNEQPNDLSAFLNDHPHIDQILLNGNKASTSFKKHCKQIENETHSLPSTSPANASMTYADKLQKWSVAILG